MLGKIEGRRGWRRMKWLDDITHSVDVNLGKLRETVKDRCQGTFNFKGSNMFSSFVCHFSRTLCSLLGPGKQEWAELHAVLRTEVMNRTHAWIPFSDLLLYYKLLSHVPITQDMDCLLALWRLCDDCYSPVSVFAQLYFCCLKLPCIKIYKHMLPQIKYLCFTRGLGSPRPSFRWLQSLGPGLQRP